MELIRALAVFAEPPNENLVHIARALGFETPTEDEYTETFLFQLYPYASVYLGAEGMLGGEARDRIAGFWRALNLTPPVEPDHLSTLLGLYANLYDEGQRTKDKEQKTKWFHVRKVLFWEHMASWLPVYLHKMKEDAPPVYLRWAELLERVLIEDANSLGQPEFISQHLLQDVSLLNPNEHGFEKFLSSLLSPASSGIILTRTDLQRAANELDLSLRIGERKFNLQTLFGQDTKKMLKWLSNEVREWLQWNTSQQEIYGETALAWAKKAELSLLLLNELGPNL